MEDMHFLVPSSTLLTLSLSLLELKTRVPTHHLPRGSSSFISQQRESDCFPFLPSYSPRGRFLSVCLWQWRQRPPSMEVVLPQTSNPKGQAGRGGSRMARGHRRGGGGKVQILAPSHISPATWARCSTFLPPLPSPHLEATTGHIKKTGPFINSEVLSGFPSTPAPECYSPKLHQMVPKPVTTSAVVHPPWHPIWRSDGTSKQLCRTRNQERTCQTQGLFPWYQEGQATSCAKDQG